jgi:uncharacterized protein YraI
MKHLRILAFAAAAMLASSTWASAQEAFTTSDVNMRAGPGSRYPVVTTIPSDREVFIHGCLSNWDWCDVSWRRNRGWVFSDNLEALYRSRRIGFDEYRTFVDIPFVSFSFGYWDRHYRNRPWFDDWDRWDDRRDRRRRGDGDWNREWDQDGDRNGDRRDSNWDGDSDRKGERVKDDDDRNERRKRRVEEPEDDVRGMRCGTPDADPSCPDNSRGRRMQMNDN